ncbi:MAG: tetratricopeptide repeat protein [Clostridia bacterium]|nr:tetratricopeptide repeat protein [Clostridia bacterium]
MITKEDYEERDCPLCMRNDGVTPISVSRMIERLDALLSTDDTAGARRHLAYWLEEARVGRDVRGEIAVLNEQMGLYRKCGMREEAYAAALAAERAVLTAGLSDTVSAATVLLNAATVCAAFGAPEEAVTRYRRAMIIYEKTLSPEDGRVAALKNNLAAALVELGEYEEALALYKEALKLGKSESARYLDAAVTLLNIADLLYRRDGAEQSADAVGALCAEADALLSDARVVRDGNYAFVADKCAAAFRFHGFFLLADKYARLSRALYGKDGADG